MKAHSQVLGRTPEPPPRSRLSPPNEPRREKPLPDAWRVEVFRRPEAGDPEGAHAVAALAELGLGPVRSARLGRGYLLSPALADDDVRRAARELFADPVLDELRVVAPGRAPAPRPSGVHRLLVARRPGVMDPVALTVERTLERSGLAPAGVRAATYQAWELEGKLGAAELAAIGRLFANEVIEEILVDDEALHFERPQARAGRGAVALPLRDADDEALARTSREGELSLSLEEMRAIREHYRSLGRDPSVCEIETLAQTWSEHCKHKTFKGILDVDGERIDDLLKHTIQAATVELARPWCVSVFADNAGVIEFDEGWHVAFKVETHNHPSAIDPYGGAGTGIGGVVRDILGVGLGAKPIANLDAFFVGPLDLPPGDLPAGSMHPRRILRGVVAGVRDYGNRMGIPTVSGGVWEHPRYVGNPLVYAGTVGLMPEGCAHKEVRPGDAIVLVGGRTGRDGIHGATFSSAELHEASAQVSSSAVQIGDPITEKRVLDGLLCARDRRLYRSVTDCGAGGLSSAVGEMGETTGAVVEIERVPLKYPGLSAAEIWISEAQERMVLAVPPESVEACLAVFAAEDVEATVIGRFGDDRRLVILDHGEVVCDLDMHFLHRGTPRPVRRATIVRREIADPGCPPCADPGGALLALCSSTDVASKEWIVRQYDHEVQGTSVLKPLVGERADGPGDAAVLRPLPGSKCGIAIACGAAPRYGLLDPWAMASAAIDEALRNVTAVGGDPARTAILDNFSWGNCERASTLGDLVQAARACYATAKAFGTPFISGKDSLNNEYSSGGETISIPPTLLVSALAIVPDVSRAVSMDLKRAGSAVYLVGLTHAELGGSHYLALAGLDGGRVPRPDLKLAPRQLRALSSAIATGLVRSCHDLSEGGLAVAAAEMAFAGELGLVIELARVPVSALAPDCDPEAVRLFSQSCSRFLVEVSTSDAPAFERLFEGLDCARVGRVQEDPRLVVLGLDGAPCIDLAAGELRRAHRGGFQG
jgi:phosphoribosylformylglycinamidine synthase II